MKIASLFSEKTVFSFEIFPPKKTSPIETVYDTLEALQDLKPDFISVTFGAGGSGNGENTLAIARRLKEHYGVLPMAHLPCIHYTKEQIDNILKQFQENGIENVLALRGDRVEGWSRHGLRPRCRPHQLYPQQDGSFDIAGACYPECHPEAQHGHGHPHLKEKVDAGASHLITQLFFDNDSFYDFRYRAARSGVNVPIEAGIMPVTNRKQIERMVTMCGASLPRKFTKMVQRFEDNPEALRDAGIAYAIDQIVDLVTDGVDGIHLYTMNNPYVARKISEAVNGIIKAAPKC
ncbi:MAG: methylenetetrahydrofolate reductase [Ruminococcus callidus]